MLIKILIFAKSPTEEELHLNIFGLSLAKEKMKLRFG